MPITQRRIGGVSDSLTDDGIFTRYISTPVEISSGVVVNATNYPELKTGGEFRCLLSSGGVQYGVAGQATIGAGILIYQMETPVVVYLEGFERLIGEPGSTVKILDVNDAPLAIPVSTTYAAIPDVPAKIKLNETEIDTLQEMLYSDAQLYKLPEMLISSGCWWTYPRAARYKKTKDKLYVGYADNNGDCWVYSYDYNTKETAKTFLYDCVGADDHNQVSVNMLPDGRLMCLYSQHTGFRKLSLKISTNPEDISEFGEEIAVEQEDEYQTQNYNQTFFCEREVGLLL